MPAYTTDVDRTHRFADAMGRVGPALLALPLGELPPIASVGIRDGLDEPLWVGLQLSSVGNLAASILSWAEVLPGASVTGREFDDYIRVKVEGDVAGVRVAVWCHLHGPDLIDIGCFLSLPPDGRSHRIPLAALHGLARRLEAAER